MTAETATNAADVMATYFTTNADGHDDRYSSRAIRDQDFANVEHRVTEGLERLDRLLSAPSGR